jgi:sugar (pentulose or hexulose) kinase
MSVNGSPARAVFLGVDVGTQGARVVALDDNGQVRASRQQAFAGMADPAREQPVDAWWATLLPLLAAVAGDLARHPGLIPTAVGVTSTSGTVVPLDREHRPLGPALMYSDDRAAEDAAVCRWVAAEAGCPTEFGSSWGLPKILWFRRTQPATAARVAAWRHAADVVVGRLSGEWAATDPTNALKTGYDPDRGRWPHDVLDRLHVPRCWLPAVVPSGTPVGPLSPEVAAATGLPRSLLVTVGITDGCASQIAAGAVEPGSWSTTLGTTLVVKGVSRSRVVDPLGRLYDHRHPEGWWMPGGASNTGAGWIARDYGEDDLAALDARAGSLSPTGLLAYPLPGQGERFPFVAPAAVGFDPPGVARVERYAARLEGVAFLERFAYELVERLSGEPVRRVATTGGGSRSETWLGIRAAVLGRPVTRPACPEGAAGAAILAASRTAFGSLTEAAGRMSQPDLVVEPPRPADAYDEAYGRFVGALAARGYLAEDAA